MRFLTMLVALATVSCSGTATDNSAPLTGAWGGPELLVTVTGHAATTEFICANGTIDQIAPDANGNFSSTGTYVFEHPAAGQAASHAARYDGQVTGNTMRVTVTVSDTQQVFGPFTVTFGAAGPSTLCQ